MSVTWDFFVAMICFYIISDDEHAFIYYVVIHVQMLHDLLRGYVLVCYELKITETKN